MKNLILMTILLGFTLPIHADKTEPEGHVYRLRWILSHEPVRVFERAARSFAEEVARKTNNKVQIEVLKNDHVVWAADAYEAVKSGRVEMTQTYTSFLGTKSKSFWALDLPFLFKDHQVAARVLDGKIGGQILASLEDQNISGLAFTYSGGYMILPTKKVELQSAADFKGLKIRVNQNSPVGASLMTTMGALPAAGEATDYAGFDGFETTYPRFMELDPSIQNEYKVINDNHHSMFLTAILINKAYLQSMPAEYRSILEATAQKVARIEREDSIADGEKMKQQLIKKGYKIVSMGPEELKKFKESARPVYKKFQTVLGKELIQDIQRD